MQPKRITANLPGALLEAAMAASGQGITETLVAGLEALLRKDALEKTKKLRGRIYLQPDAGRKLGSPGN